MPRPGSTSPERALRGAGRGCQPAFWAAALMTSASRALTYFNRKATGSSPAATASSSMNCSLPNWICDPVGPQIQFGSEQFIDELAVAAGEDPVAFRLKYITAPRDAAVIKAAAEKAGWQPRSGPRDRSGDVLSGRGIAYARRNGTIVATVAEIEVERKTG